MTSERSWELAELVSAVGNYGTGYFSESLAVHVSEWVTTAEAIPSVTVVLPVYNQARFISRCLDRLNESVTLPADLVVICDAPTDGTTARVFEWISQAVQSGTINFGRVALARPARSVFETLSDTIGFALSRSNFAVEVQADMLIEEKGFDQRMVGWFGSVPSLLAVGGRGAHSFRRAGIRCPAGRVSRAAAIWDRLYLLTTRAFGPGVLRSFAARHGSLVGRIGDLIEVPEGGKDQSLYLHDTVMRGPLALDLRKFRSLGGFDTSQFFLGDDDHELAHRGWATAGLRVGYTPVRFSSPLSAGSTRRVRDALEEAEYLRVKKHYAEIRLEQGGDARHHEACAHPPRARVAPLASEATGRRENA